MADLTAEQHGQLPDFVKEDYEQVGDVFRHRAEGKLAVVKQTANDLDTKYKTTEKSLSDFRAQQEAAIEKAKTEALEQARTSGDVAAVEKRYKEQMADLEKRSGEAKAALEERLKARDERFVKSEKVSVLSDIRAKLGIFDSVSAKFNKLIGDRIDVNVETGERVFLDENGGATSLDLAGFISELEKDESLDFWRKSDANRGGQSKGNSVKTGGAHKKFADYTGAELVQISKNNPDEYARLLKTR